MNLNQTFSILFWLNHAKKNRKGFVPIWIRITVDRKRAECSTSRSILAEHWDAAASKANDQCPDASAINNYLVGVYAEISKHYHTLLITKDYVTADDVKRSFRGVKEIKKSFLEVYREYLKIQEAKRDSGHLSKGRVARFHVNYNKCLHFIKYKYKRVDMILDEIKLPFLVELHHYLTTVEHIGHNTAMKHAKDVKQFMKYAVTMQYLVANPFADFQCSYKKVKRRYLTAEDLELLAQHPMPVKRLEEVRDCFLFSCYTGYAFADTRDLTHDDIMRGIDGHQWVIKDRIKTNSAENVPLLPVPMEIIEKYRKHPYCMANNKLLPINSNQNYNAYLKEIADICGIKRTLTTHVARHTFATTVCLANGVPIETVQKLLGHEDIRTTQIYAEVVPKKISNDMNALRDILASALQLKKSGTES